MTVHAMTAIGQRPNNEDALVVGGEVFLNEANLSRRDVEFVAVLDGVGGSPRGEVASSVGAYSLAKAFRSDMDEEALRSALMQAHLDVAGQQQGPAEKGPFSTLVGIARLNDGYYFFNLGDSISLLYSHGHLRQVSMDDSTTPNVYEYGLDVHGFITYCLGQPGLLRGDFHIQKADLVPGDVVLITSDGITSTIPFLDLEDILRQSMDGKEQFDHIVEEVGRRVSLDNYTLALCEL